MALECPAGPRRAPTARLECRASFSYYRVSTERQGASGLGLEAQREAVARHVAAAQGVLVDEFQEIESGKKNDRPEIAAALAACRLRRATLDQDDAADRLGRAQLRMLEAATRRDYCRRSAAEIAPLSLPVAG